MGRSNLTSCCLIFWVNKSLLLSRGVRKGLSIRLYLFHLHCSPYAAYFRNVETCWGGGEEMGKSGKGNHFLMCFRMKTPARYVREHIVIHGVCSCQLVVPLLSRVWLSVSPWTAERQASLSFTISWNLFRLKSIESVMPSNHLILGHPPSPPVLNPSYIRGFSSESALHIR